MTAQTVKEFGPVTALNATSKDAVAQLVKAWESKNAQRAARGAGLGLMAVSLAACGGSGEVAPPAPPAPPVDPVQRIALTSDLDLFGQDAPTNDHYIGGNNTLTSGDRIATTGTVTLDLSATNIDGQTIAASVVTIDASNGVSIEASDWTVSTVRIADSRGNVSVLDLQSTATNLVIDDLVDPAATATFNFDAQALTGASIVTLSLSEVTSAVALTGGAIETVNITIADKATDAESTLVDFTATGNTTLNISGGTAGYDFTITGDLDAGITTLNGSTALSDLNLSIASSTTKITASTGLGDDVLATGDRIGDLDEQDTFDGNAGKDELTAVFTTAGTRNPISSEFETFTLTFNNSATLDFTEVDDVATINVEESTFRAQLIDMDNTVTKINLIDGQTGEWDVDYESGEDADLDFTWSNNSGATQTISGIVFDEVQDLKVIADGTDDVVFGDSASGDTDFNVDDEDTVTLSFNVDGNGDMTVEAIGTSSAVETLTLTTTDTGDLTVKGTEGEGMLEAESLETLSLSASSAGDITLGIVGAVSSSADQLELIEVESKGADITLGNVVATLATISQYNISMDADAAYKAGTIAAQDISEMTIFVEQDADVDLDDISMTVQGDTLVTSGEGTVDSITFTAEAFAEMTFAHTADGAAAADSGISVDFSKAKAGSIVSTTEDGDTVQAGLGENAIETNAGKDYVVVAATSVATNKIDTGADVDFIVLSAVSGDDVVQPGGTAVAATTGALSTLATIDGNIDTIKNFAAGDDHIALHTVAGSASNYLELDGDATKAGTQTFVTYADALAAADIAMDNTVIYVLAEVGSSSNKAVDAGTVANVTYLFADTNSDGDADIVVAFSEAQLGNFGFDEILAMSDFIA